MDNLQFPYINIHTHFEDFFNDEISIMNIFGSEIHTIEFSSGLRFSIGIHPWHIKPEDTEETMKAVENLASKPHIIAIGEIGIDRKKKPSIEIQTDVFIRQIDLSIQLQKPVIIHCVKGHSDVLGIRKSKKTTIPWIIHNFTENELIAKKYIESGCYLSFGSILLKNTPLQNLLKNLPLSNIFFETDNSDHSVRDIYKLASGIFEISLSDLKQRIHQNFIDVFGD